MTVKELLDRLEAVPDDKEIHLLIDTGERQVQCKLTDVAVTKIWNRVMLIAEREVRSENCDTIV